jgi:hypothetical protein
MIICRVCGHHNSSGYEICRACGAMMDEYDDGESDFEF